MSVIELGEVASSPGEDPDGRPAPGLDRRLLRQVTLAASTLLVVLVVNGSAVPQPHGVRLLWSVPAVESDGSTVTTDTAYLQHTEPGSVRLTAYTLATGAVRWSRDIAATVGYVQPVEAAGIVLLPTDRRTVEPPRGEDDIVTSELYRETIALDARTGAERWRVVGEPQTVADDTALMTEYTEEGTFARIRLIRLADHSTVWAKEIPGVQNHTVAWLGDRPDRFITATGAGEINVFRYADGTLVTRARIPWVTPRPEEGYFNDLIAGGDYLVVNRAQRETFELTVYRVDTMTELWHAKDTNGYAFFCGSAALCLNLGDGIVAHDTATGRRRWHLDRAANIWPVSEGRLLLDDGVGDGHPTLIDTVTGTAVGEPAEGSTVWSPRPSDALLLLRATVSPPGQTSVTRWDLRTGRRDLLGAMGLLPGNRCQAVDRYLACARESRFEVIAVGW
jgi:hypothetical protein